MTPTQGCDRSDQNYSSAQQRNAWLQLLHSPRLSTTSVLALIEQYGSAAALIANHDPIHHQQLTLALNKTNHRAVEADLAWCQQQSNRHIITLGDPRYPALLRKIPDPPMVLYIIGDPGLLQLPQLAIVGSRNPTANGLDTATAFANHLSQSGILITSGLAIGIDGAAHQGALLAKQPTIAVTGCGLDRVYPSRHKTLASSIIQHGALVSEFSPGTPPLAANFPRRNRIISGLSLGTLVIEAALRSGSLITAHLAIEQGREVFAIPGSIHNPLSRGCHKLLKEGACLVESSEDVLAELGSLLGTLLSLTPPQLHPDKITCPVEAQPLWPHIHHDPVDIDTLIERSGLTAERVSAMLLLMELDGCITTIPGGRFCRA